MNPIDPHADLRQLAALHFQMFTAWKDAGFTDVQALSLMRAMVKAVTRGGP